MIAGEAGQKTSVPGGKHAAPFIQTAALLADRKPLITRRTTGGRGSDPQRTRKHDMKRVLLAAALAVVISSSTGCCALDWMFGHGGCAGCCGKCGPYPGCGSQCGPGGGCSDGCGPNGCGAGGYGPAGYGGGGGGCGPGGCGPGGCARRAPGPMDDGSAFAGPPTGGVTYPYYTTRGPRDFLASNPRGIGPNP